jgi:hypothetical protein
MKKSVPTKPLSKAAPKVVAKPLTKSVGKAPPQKKTKEQPILKVTQISPDYDSDFDEIDSSDEEAVAELKAKKAKLAAQGKSAKITKVEPKKLVQKVEPKTTHKAQKGTAPPMPAFKSAAELDSDDDFSGDDEDDLDLDFGGDDEDDFDFDEDDYDDDGDDDDDEAEIIQPKKAESAKTNSKSAKTIIKEEVIEAPAKTTKNKTEAKPLEPTTQTTMKRKNPVVKEELDEKNKKQKTQPNTKQKHHDDDDDVEEIKEEIVKKEEIKFEGMESDDDFEEEEEEIDDEELYGWKLNSKTEQQDEAQRELQAKLHFQQLRAQNARADELRKQRNTARQEIARNKRKLRRHNSNLTIKLAIHQNYRPHRF